MSPDFSHDMTVQYPPAFHILSMHPLPSPSFVFSVILNFINIINITTTTIPAAAAAAAAAPTTTVRQ
jgi:hypothetical protein